MAIKECCVWSGGIIIITAINKKIELRSKDPDLQTFLPINLDKIA